LLLWRFCDRLKPGATGRVRCESLGGGIICQLRWNGRNGELRAELAYSLVFCQRVEQADLPIGQDRARGSASLPGSEQKYVN
jgi:hypothetical protein